MFERYTERARQVVVLAQDEARALKHNSIGTEHILLGLLRVEDASAARVLDAFDITVEDVRAQVTRIVGPSTEADAGAIPFTPGARDVLDQASREALSLGEPSVDTAHILLCLVGVDDDVAARILRDLDAGPEKIRDEVLRMLSTPGRARRQREWKPYAQLLIACPTCASPIETISTDRPNSSFSVSAEGDRTCPGCGAVWALEYAVSWRELSG